MYENIGIPDCVPELIRSRREEECRQYALEEAARKRYIKNQENLAQAEAGGLPILQYGGYPECDRCNKKNTDTVRDEFDDFGLVICLDPECSCHDGAYTKKESDTPKAEESPMSFRSALKGLELLNDLTVENVKKFARRNFSLGGDGIVECMEDSDIQKLVNKGKEAVISDMEDWYERCLDIQGTAW